MSREAGAFKQGQLSVADWLDDLADCIESDIGNDHPNSMEARMAVTYRRVANSIRDKVAPLMVFDK